VAGRLGLPGHLAVPSASNIAGEPVPTQNQPSEVNIAMDSIFKLETAPMVSARVSYSPTSCRFSNQKFMNVLPNFFDHDGAKQESELGQRS
jgi:hypothetical protein